MDLDEGKSVQRCNESVPKLEHDRDSRNQRKSCDSMPFVRSRHGDNSPVGPDSLLSQEPRQQHHSSTAGTCPLEGLITSGTRQKSIKPHTDNSGMTGQAQKFNSNRNLRRSRPIPSRRQASGSTKTCPNSSSGHMSSFAQAKDADEISYHNGYICNYNLKPTAEDILQKSEVNASNSLMANGLNTSGQMPVCCQPSKPLSVPRQQTQTVNYNTLFNNFTINILNQGASSGATSDSSVVFSLPKPLERQVVQEMIQSIQVDVSDVPTAQAHLHKLLQEPMNPQGMDMWEKLLEKLGATEVCEKLQEWLSYG